ncbi:LysR family transcriptional regulator [Actinocrispum wychmicini]|uniref:DNA-binding transcriptional LysR family regulator n=1 Tax=Actinocrispum wychmicini TaxID=1213861 RepID=A0A4R2JCB8_9PSEU|nr:LysR family transcriptional regulator [Actinocrispum wychmicini]TCO57201.1 DNA-binding transcriptional LysR family regulator [Actinocrispum wychmicini]
MTPDLASLRLLVLVGELGSIGRAAATLGIAQPSASKRLAALERRFGLALVDRTRRGSALTPDGRVVTDWARRVLDELNVLVTGAEALRTRRQAELRVAASLTVAEHLVPGWIGELRRARPDVYVGLMVTNSSIVCDLVRGGDVDLGFVESPTVPTELSARRVASDRLAVVVPPGHPWVRRRRPLAAADLAAAPLVVREHGSGTRETLERALRQAKVGQLRPLAEFGSTTAVRSAVVEGAGPAVLSVLAVDSDLAEGRLVEVAVDDLDLRRQLRAVWPGGRRLIGTAAELLAIALRGGRGT